MLRFFISASFVFSSHFAFAQAKLDANKPVKIEYESKSWNKNPNAEDSSAIIMRDSKTKKVVRVQLQETGPNTALFVGNYSVSWGDSELLPEIYVAPQDMIKTAEQLKKFEKMIQEGILLRKPYFARADEKNNQILTIYDTKEQALQALEDYRRLRMQTSSPVSSATLEAQAKAARLAEMKEKELLAQKQQQERERLEADEKKRQEELKRQQESLAAEEKARRQKKAKELGEEGLALYKEGKYPDAEAKFQQATELDPSNTSFYYQYGVTLYRNANYNKSLVILGLAQGGDVNPTERDFFIGSNYMKLKDNENAIKTFESVKKQNDKNLSAPAAFYEGLIQYQKEEYDASKANFEYVLDQSSDPTLDKQAETYIEQIANIMAFKKEASKKFILTLNGGLMYDSNILLVANSQLNQPTDLAGYRWTYGATLEYRPVYNFTHEFSAILSASDMFSQDTKFKAAQNFQNTDPLTFSLYLPYKYKGMAFKKAYQMTLSPGYETTQMNQDGTGSRETILNSIVLKNDHTFVMNDNWFATYSLELRQDTSLIDASLTPDDDLTASKYTLGTTQTFFQNQKKTEAWVGELGVAQNNAKGKNSTYTRFDLAATYMAPWKWDTTWTARLGYYNANYTQHTTGRMDNDTSLTLGLRKPFSEKLAGTLSGTYTNNASTLETSNYNKYLIMTVFTWTGYL